MTDAQTERLLWYDSTPIQKLNPSQLRDYRELLHQLEAELVKSLKIPYDAIKYSPTLERAG
jgi:hypothetical protein